LTDKVKRYAFVDLFSGGGGFCIGLERSGLKCIAHSEIDADANKILEKNWPNIPNLGSVTEIKQKLNCHVVVGGSPCQDLSIANQNREGLTGQRSNLFYEQHRIWQESSADLLLWENVLGAYSANKGADFAAVLSTLCGSAVEIPSSGWKGGGMAIGSSASVFWRTLDARYFGVPQRRKRVFVVADKQRRDASEILSFSDMVQRSYSRDQQFFRSVDSASGKDDSGLVFVRQIRAKWYKANKINTITQHEKKDTHHIVVRSDGAARKLTEVECEALMSWPKNHTEHEDIAFYNRYKLLGNGVVSNVAEAIGKRIITFLESHESSI